VNEGLFPAGFGGGAQVVTLLYNLCLSIFSVCLSPPYSSGGVTGKEAGRKLHMMLAK
jgi:hypothetical protein